MKFHNIPAKEVKRLDILQNPIMEGVIGAIIFISILAEIKTAGFSGGGIVAAVFGLLLIGSHWTGDGWQISELLLYFGGMILIFLDLLFLATGAAAVAGLIAMAAALYFVFGAGVEAMYVLAASIVLSVIGMCFLASHLSENRLWRKITLSFRLTSHEGYISSIENLSKWKGKHGVACTVLRPAGKVNIDGSILDAVTVGDFIEKGTPVVVLKTESNRVVVQKIDVK